MSLEIMTQKIDSRRDIISKEDYKIDVSSKVPGRHVNFATLVVFVLK